VTGIIPGRRPTPAVVSALPVPERMAWLKNPYVALATANNQFNDFSIKPKRMRWVSKAALAILLCLSVSLFSISHNVSIVQATPIIETLYISLTDSAILTTTHSHQLTDSSVAGCDVSDSGAKPGKAVQWTQFIPNNSNNVAGATPCPSSATGTGWIYEAAEFDATDGKLDGDFTFYYYDSDNQNNVGRIQACLYAVEISGTAMGASTLLNTGTLDNTGTDMWDAAITEVTKGFTDPCGSGCDEFTETQKYLYADFYIYSDGSANNATSKMYFGQNQCGTNYPAIVIDEFVIPEKILLIAIVVPFIPVMALWIKKRKEGLVFINS